MAFLPIPASFATLNAQSVSGFTQFGAQPSSPQFQNPTVYNPKANFTWVHGVHSMKFGYEYQAVNTQVNDFNPSYGQDNYAAGYAAASRLRNATRSANLSLRSIESD